MIQRIKFLSLLVLVLLLISGCFIKGPSVPVQNPILTVHFIDVGQGDSIFIDIGDNEILIDGGEISPGVTDYIKPYVQGKLEVVVATHPHDDHIGGLISVLQKYDVGEIWINGDNSTTNTYKNFMKVIYSENADVHTARRGDTIHSRTLNLTVLNPVQPLTLDANNNSIVLNLSYGNTDFLFTGDAGEQAEKVMLSKSGMKLSDVDILKVGHHGSSSATTQDFLTAIHPEVAVYEAGIGNPYGHPHQEVIDRLKANNVKIYGTDKNGTVVVTTDGISYKVVAQKGTYEN